MKSAYLLTGRPGTGKTTLIKQAVADLEMAAGGFYTEEIRSGATRLGFRLVTLDGRETTLAHVDFNKRFRVGKYGVDVAALDSVGVPALRKAAGQCDLVIIDEIGKMELFSTAFREAVSSIIESGKTVLGTIMLQPNPWADAVRRLPQVQLVTVTGTGYHQVLYDLRNFLKIADKSPA